MTAKPARLAGCQPISADFDKATSNDIESAELYRYIQFVTKRRTSWAAPRSARRQ